MLTLGVDLAAQPANTAACVVAWLRQGAEIRSVTIPADDAALTALRAGVQITAIDAPFGWPEQFVEAMTSWQADRAWPGTEPKELALRLTDRLINPPPLSASSDRIGVCAWRCAKLLTRWEVNDLLGGQDVVEVYPAAALRAWGLSARGYKRDAEIRARLLAELRDRCPWMTADDEVWDSIAGTDHAFDALICALVGRAVLVGQAEPPPSGDRATIEAEGWIHVPSGSVGDLGRANA